MTADLADRAMRGGSCAVADLARLLAPGDAARRRLLPHAVRIDALPVEMDLDEYCAGKDCMRCGITEHLVHHVG
jgi:hypothetical protein